MTSTKIEFLVQMTCEACVKAVKKSLENVDGVKNVDVNLEKGSVLVESSLPTLEIQERLKSTGRPVAIKGYDGSIAAVSIIEAGDENVKGVIRFVQATPNVCIIDGTIDGLRPGDHNLQVHECGDLSRGCESVGKIFNPDGYNGPREYGNLGKIFAERNGRAAFRFEDNVLKLTDVIGRAFVVSSKYTVPTIPQNLSKEETIVQIVEVLEHLNEITQDIFSKVKQRIQVNSDNLSSISKRVDVVASKVELLKGDTRAKTVFSSSKYPAVDVNKDYVSIFKDSAELSCNRREVAHTKYVSNYEPLTKLQFYHVKPPIQNNDGVSEGLGDVPSDIQWFNDLLLFNSGKNLYMNFTLTDSLNGPETSRVGEFNSTSEIGDAPYSISQRSSLQHLNKDNYFYSPKVEELPALDVPLDLPDLPGIADDLRYETDIGSSIAPSLLNQSQTISLDLPNVADIVTSKMSPPPPPPPPVEIPEPPMQEPIKDTLVLPSEDNEKSNLRIESIPPPDSAVDSGPLYSEKTVSAPSFTTSQNDPRASLMDAIRKAGGSQKANLKKTTEIKNSASGSSSGDLMADLHSKLMMRRKGISGAKNTDQSNTNIVTPDSTLARMSSMIPPPTKSDVESSVSTDDDDDWNE